MLSVLLIFQTLLAPISTLAAELSTVNEADQPTSAPATLTEANDGATVKDKNGDDSNSMLETTTSSVKNETEATPEATPEPSQEPPEVKPTETPETEATQGEENAKSEEAEAEDKADEVQALNTSLLHVDLTTSARLEAFELKIDGTDVVSPAFTTELAQNQQANGKFVFKVDLPGDVKAGDYFTYSLPASLIDFNGAFHGKKDPTAVSPAFKWETKDSQVTVTITEDPSADIAGSTDVGFEMNFTSGFNLSGNNVEQTLVIPSAGGGTENVKLTFLPSTSSEKMVSKKSKGVTIDDGERTIDWEVWVNKAGKNLTNATITDTPGSGHIIVPDSVTVETYEVGLTGVAATATDKQSNKKFEELVLNGRNAYKITYQTKVNLPIAEQEGTKEFSNLITLTDPTYGDSDTKKASTTYGKALEKSLDGTKINNNYISSWEVRYNYNQAAIDQADARIEDKLPTGHVIDISTIKVYEVTVNDTGTATGAGTEIDKSKYQVNPIINSGRTDGFTLAFNNDITNAYRITYDAKLPNDFYSNNNATTMTNSVISGTVKDPKTATHTLTEDILTKSRTVNTDTKEITWTITVKADNANGKDITGLTIADTFTKGSHDALHTLVDANNDSVINASDITVSHMTGQNISIDANGFTLTSGTVAKGQTATITYKTAYEILPDGSVHEQGYGNKAIASWTTDKPYSVEKSAYYKPESNSVNNGRKKGKYDYVDQVFNWDIKVNINKQNINNAVLSDVIGEGHEIMPDSFEVKEFTLTNSNNDEIGTEGANLSADLYSLNIPADNKSFILTLDNDLGAANNKVYIVKYQTKDSNKIIGIESSSKADNKSYTNTATFTTNVGGNSKVYNLPATPVTVTDANKLIEKDLPTSNSTTERLTWTLNVNRSLSTLGKAKVKDVPSENQMLLKETILVRESTVNKDTGVSFNGDWSTPASLGLTVTFTANGGFEIDFGELNKKSYQIQYQTLVLGKQGEAFSNEAKIDFDFATADNQEKEVKYENSFSFSASDADFSLTKGNLKFNKVGLNGLTGIKQPLAGVEFELVKIVKGSPYVVATATSDQDGNVVFENVNYANYIIKEKAAPEGYTLMGDYTIKLDKNTDTKLDENATKVIELVNNENIDTSNACEAFTLTVKDIDGKPIANETIKLIDSNGDEKYTGTTNSDGQVSDIKRPGEDGKGVQAGLYTVLDNNNATLGTILIKYGQGECTAIIMPDRSISCPQFTIKGLEDYEGEEVIISSSDFSEKLVVKSGEVKYDSTKLPAGTYKVEKVNNGKTLLIGSFKVTYKSTNCNTKVEIAKKCEDFILTLKNANGEKLNNGEEVIIKYKDQNDNLVLLDNNATYTVTDGQVKLKNLEPKEYFVYEKNGTILIGSFISNFYCEAIVQPILQNVCPEFELTINDPNDVINIGESVVVELTSPKDKDIKESINIVIEKKEKGILVYKPSDITVLPAGEYNVYYGVIQLGSLNVDYTSCKAELNLALMNELVCPKFELTINDMQKQPRKNIAIKIFDKNNQLIVEDTTNNDGKIKINNSILKVKEDYIVKKGNEIIGNFSVNKDCMAIIQPDSPVVTPTPVCEEFTITVKGLNGDQNTTRPGATVELKDNNGSIIVIGITNRNGEITFSRDNLPEGNYLVFVNNKFEKTIGITLQDCSTEVIIEQPAPSCPQVTVTLKDENGKARPNVDVTIKDSEGKTVATGTTDKDGKVTTEQPLTPGKYVVYEGDKKVGEFTKDATNCEYEVTTTPAPSCPQVTITVTDKDGKARKDVDITIKDAKDKVVLTGFTNDEGKLTTGKPLPKGKYIVYEVDKKVGEFVVDGTNCEFDVTTTEKPEEPNCDKPEPGQPTDPDCEEEPNKPGEGGENPVDPNNPGEGGENPVDPNNPGTDGGKPVDPNNPNQGGGDGGKPVDPNNPNQNGSDNGKPVNPNKPGTDHNTTNDGKNPNKLPQTDGASNTIFVYIGLVLMAISAFIFFRRKATAK